jgi:hypothetical protein
MRSGNQVLRAAAILAFLIVGATCSYGGIVTFPDFSSWEAAVTNVTTVTIPEPSDDYYDYFGTGSGSVTYSGVLFSSSATLSNGNFFNIGTLFSEDPAVLSSQEQSTGVANILITFPVEVTGFALYYGTFNGSDVTFTLSNGDSVTQGSTGSGYAVPDFVGVTDAPFSMVLVTSPDYGMNLNDVSYSSAVPEPAAGLLLMSGLAGLSLWRRRTCR